MGSRPSPPRLAAAAAGLLLAALAVAPALAAPPKIRFAFLLYPDDVKVAADRDLTLCLVNLGETNSLLLADGDRLSLSIPVGPAGSDLADALGVQGLGCTAPADWSCTVDLSDPEAARVDLEPAPEVLVEAEGTSCFTITGLTVNGAEGLAFTEMEQDIHPQRALMPDDPLLPIFKSLAGTIRHDDLADVLPDQHHVQTWEVSGDDTYSLFPGSVGIGTSSPQRKLHVAGSGLFGGELFLGGTRTSLVGFDGAGNHWLRTDGDEGRLWLAFHQSGGAPSELRIPPGSAFDLQTGDLAVGHDLTVGAGPGGRLVVEGSGVVNDLVKLLRTDNHNALRLSTPHGAAGDPTVPTAVRFGVSSDDASYTTAMALVTKTGGCCDQGNVGIGTLKPQARLQVDGGTDVEPGSGGYLVVGDPAGTNLALDDNELMARDGGATATLFLQVDGGAVAIGTTSVPSGYVMAVDGSIRTKEVVVETGWSDDVFAAGYELRPLAGVVDFIAEHGHLPDVPTAADVEAHGVGVGEMSSTLLRKVEELTLYVADLDRRLGELQAENRELRRSLGTAEGAER